MAIMCPHCEVFTSFSPVLIKGKGLLIGTSSDYRDIWEEVAIGAVTDPRNMLVEGICYAILVCQACGKWFVASRSQSVEEWSAVYPILHRDISEYIPESIKGEFEEALLCFEVKAYRACLLMCRATVEDLQRDRKVSTLKELWQNGTISETFYCQADQVRLWGNLVAHKLIMPQVITKDDSEQLLTYLEAMLDAIYVQPKKLAQMTDKYNQLKKGTDPKSPYVT